MDFTMTISHELKRKTLFKKVISPEKLLNMLALRAQSKKFTTHDFSQITEYHTKEIIESIHDLRHLHNKNKSTIEYLVECNDQNSILHERDIKSLALLEHLELIGPPKTQFKKSDNFNFEHSSSGEKNILYSMINLLANTHHNSLILIDEPEISLHPAWQMHYINLLKNVLSNFVNTHCILATHSHFMVSDLDPESSDLTTVNLEADTHLPASRRFTKIDYSTYAWSAENILYKVFNLRTTRNYYFEQELAELLGLISKKSKNKTRAIELIGKFENLVLDEADPLNLVLLDANNFIKNDTPNN